MHCAFNLQISQLSVADINQLICRWYWFPKLSVGSLSNKNTENTVDDYDNDADNDTGIAIRVLFGFLWDRMLYCCNI